MPILFAFLCCLISTVPASNLRKHSPCNLYATRGGANCKGCFQQQGGTFTPRFSRSQTFSGCQWDNSATGKKRCRMKVDGVVYPNFVPDASFCALSVADEEVVQTCIDDASQRKKTLRELYMSPVDQTNVLDRRMFYRGMATFTYNSFYRDQTAYEPRLVPGAWGDCGGELGNPGSYQTLDKSTAAVYAAGDVSILEGKNINPVGVTVLKSPITETMMSLVGVPVEKKLLFCGERGRGIDKNLLVCMKRLSYSFDFMWSDTDMVIENIHPSQIKFNNKGIAGTRISYTTEWSVTGSPVVLHDACFDNMILLKNNFLDNISNDNKISSGGSKTGSIIRDAANGKQSQQQVHTAFSQGPVLLHSHMHAKVEAALTKSAEAIWLPVFLSRFGTIIIGNTVGNDVSGSSMSGTTELLQAVRNFS